MSLYHEAAEVLVKVKSDGGSLKSTIFGKKSWKSDPKTLYALTVEAAKWSSVLVEVVEKSDILRAEKSLTPTLALLLAHDLLLAKKGIALPQKHGLVVAVTRHRARLSAELTKARIRRACASLDDLRSQINQGEDKDSSSGHDNIPTGRHPRWIRVNTLKVKLADELATTFSRYKHASTLKEIIHSHSGERILYIDEHVPNLIAIAGPDDPTKLQAYKDGRLILQEKASCFPAYLLDPRPDDGGVLDTCAAPGNKTTHLAAIVAKGSHIVACEKDALRSSTLEKMVKLAGASDVVTVKRKQDFLKLDPNSREYAKVDHLLLDPSCSGSGIFGRDEGTITVHLPSAAGAEDNPPKSRKRKRPGPRSSNPEPNSQNEMALIEELPEQEDDVTKLKTRLELLSTFQLRLLRHAMSFPAAKRITYSTCSVHAEENETVVVRTLLCDTAVARGWRILRRDKQIDGMRRWHRRGQEDAVQAAVEQTTKSHHPTLDSRVIAEACIRCEKGGPDGTMGFFVAGFVRDQPNAQALEEYIEASHSPRPLYAKEEDEWEGFSEGST